MQTFSLKCLVVSKRFLYYLNKKYGIPCPQKNSSWHTQKKDSATLPSNRTQVNKWKKFFIPQPLLFRGSQSHHI